MSMDLLYMFFDAANMHRWNDHIRPLDLTELDKQAHKAAIAWVLGKSWETETNNRLDWRKLIEHSVFSFIERSVMTDIKPPLFHRIKAEKSEEVADFVMSEVRKLSVNAEFLDRMDVYMRSSNDSVEDQVLRAAHFLATNWEFSLIYDMNRKSVGIDNTKKSIENELFQHKQIIGNMQKALYGHSTTNFIDLIGQLRFQKRWTRTPRIPETTVLGHSLLVANMVFLNDCDSGVSDRTIYNDYYTALFHDLPEVLTKDVITPVKANVDGLSEMLETYEKEMVESKIMPMIPSEWTDEFRFLIYDPFSDKEDSVFGKVCGKRIKAFDLMGAYMEARLSRYYGISSPVLKKAEKTTKDKIEKFRDYVDVDSLLKDLEKICI
ncbi:MAG: HD domain-containing protein [Candidatus Methanomethylophilaceae archaeon]|nr:HD domain-containing protein [Candidatus Methanomethylophilaceae archaeon]